MTDPWARPLFVQHVERLPPRNSLFFDRYGPKPWVIVTLMLLNIISTGIAAIAYFLSR